MTIAVGSPCLAQDIKDAVTAKYPEYIPLLTFPDRGNRMLAQSVSDTNSVALAFLATGGISIRQASITIGGNNYDVQGGGLGPGGYNESIGETFLTGNKILAPTSWAEFTSSNYTDTVFALADVDAQLAAAIGSKTELAYLITFYQQNPVVTTKPYAAQLRVALR